MSVKLHYFDTPGFGEAIRWMLHYGEIKFQDMRYNMEQWAKIKESFPYGRLPVFEDEQGRHIHQSIAILRFLAHRMSLLVGDSFEDARLDAIVLTIYDMFKKVQEYTNEKDAVKKQHMKREFEEETVEFFFRRFEKDLKEHGGFFAGKLTWADMVFVAMIEVMDKYMGMHLEAEFPAVMKLMDYVRNLPAIKAFLKSRKPYMM